MHGLKLFLRSIERLLDQSEYLTLTATLILPTSLAIGIHSGKKPQYQRFDEPFKDSRPRIHQVSDVFLGELVDYHTPRVKSLDSMRKDQLQSAISPPSRTAGKFATGAGNEHGVHFCWEIFMKDQSRQLGSPRNAGC